MMSSSAGVVVRAEKGEAATAADKEDGRINTAAKALLLHYKISLS
jgi:hypothetical protein